MGLGLFLIISAAALGLIIMSVIYHLIREPRQAKVPLIILVLWFASSLIDYITSPTKDVLGSLLVGPLSLVFSPARYAFQVNESFGTWFTVLYPAILAAALLFYIRQRNK